MVPRAEADPHAVADQLGRRPRGRPLLLEDDRVLVRRRAQPPSRTVVRHGAADVTFRPVRLRRRRSGASGLCSRKPWPIGAVELPGEGQLAGGFDADRDRPEVRLLGEGDGGGEHRPLLHVGVEARDQALVELDDVERQVAREPEGVLARAEAVERDQHPEALDLPQGRAHPLGVALDAVLADLQAQGLSGEAKARELLADPARRGRAR